MFKFEKYTVEELKECGKAFVGFLDKNKELLFELPGTAEWTEVVLDWFSATASDANVVDARPSKYAISDSLLKLRKKKILCPRNTYSEFLVDLCHSDFPSYSSFAFYSRDYWASALKERRRIRLALESEWGKYSSKPANYAKIMEDATKLAVVRADCKILVFGTLDQPSHEEVIKDVGLLRKQTGDKSPWLLIDAPKSNWREGQIQPSVLVIAGEDEA